MVENERAKISVLDSESFLNKVKELVGEQTNYTKNNQINDALNKLEEAGLQANNLMFSKSEINAKELLNNLEGAKIPKDLSVENF